MKVHVRRRDSLPVSTDSVAARFVKKIPEEAKLGKKNGKMRFLRG